MPLTILSTACLLAQGHGFMATTAEDIMTGGVATTGTVGAETMTDSAIVTGFVAKADGMVMVESAGTKASAGATTSTVTDSVAATSLMVAEGSMAAEIVEVPTAVAASMVAMGPAEGAAGS